MAASPESVSIAMFCDFENVALGVRDAKFDKFDIKPVLERLLLKGSIVVKKAYCDWERYKGFKAAMHEANFELIEIPHVRQSGKNSADIRMVVDALDLCYTKSHVDTFVIVSGDSDFSPLVSKLRENAKHVIGVGIKQSTSDLLIANCDEFIFYDDLVRESQRAVVRRDPKAAQSVPRLSPEEHEARKAEAIELAVATFEALVVERGESGKIWSSMLKEAMKRRKPDFNESHFGFRSFGNLLEEAQARGLLEIGRDEKSGAFVSRSGAVQPIVAESAAMVEEPAARPEPKAAEEGATAAAGRRGRNRGKRNGQEARKTDAEVLTPAEPAAAAAPAPEAPDAPEAPAAMPAAKPRPERGPGGRARTPAKDRSAPAAAQPEAPAAERAAEAGHPPEPLPTPVAEDAPAPKPAASRGRRPRKPKAAPAAESAAGADKS
ncbi:NYN domain-containing protein [Propionivibrio sp.]|uniref:NYN domain-containing protein n=1 Tax=Propionivibrio sp. TaxID=2212460 RepID=UPI0039E4800D